MLLVMNSNFLNLSWNFFLQFCKNWPVSINKLFATFIETDLNWSKLIQNTSNSYVVCVLLCLLIVTGMRKLEAVNGYRFHLRCSTILALNVFLTQNKQLKHTITRVCEASCCRKYPLLNSQKFESTAVC